MSAPNAGVIALVDCEGMSVARNVRPAALRFLLTSLREHMPLRLGGVLVARPAVWLRHVWSAVGWLVKAKIRERVVVVDEGAQLATWLEPEARACARAPVPPPRAGRACPRLPAPPLASRLSTPRAR